jgi:hypothetical protein
VRGKRLAACLRLPATAWPPAVGATAHVALFVASDAQLEMVQQRTHWAGPLIRAFMVGWVRVEGCWWAGGGGRVGGRAGRGGGLVVCVALQEAKAHACATAIGLGI